MSTFAVLLLCIQACLVQNVLSQCASRAGLVASAPVAALAPAGCGSALGLGGISPAAYGINAASFAPGSIAYTPAAFSPATAIGSGAGYGGIGEGNVAVTGELPIYGNTAVAGQVPISGIVNFNGAVPAAGAVSISGNCACGCSSIY